MIKALKLLMFRWFNDFLWMINRNLTANGILIVFLLRRLLMFYFQSGHNKKKSKSNLHDARGITPKRVTSGGAHLRSLAPRQHTSEETS